MKTLILAINAKYIHTSLAPWYLKAAVRAYNAGASFAIPEPEIRETNINQPAEDILAEIGAAGPDILAISCYIWNITLVEGLIGEISRRLPDCLIILGGPEVSFNAAERLRALPAVDYIVRGEGEGPFTSLLAALHDYPGGAALSAIPGLAWRLAGNPVLNPVREAEGEPPDPYLPEYGESVGGRMVYLETSRGCPFSCGFCLSGLPGNARSFSIERARGDLLYLANSGTGTVKLVDRTFNSHPPRSREIIRFILASREAGAIPPNVCFHFEVAGDLFDRETIELLRNAPAGLFQLEIGLQSFDAQSLEAFGRKTDLAKLGENFRLLREGNNVHLHLDLIAGLPGEGYEAFGKSFDQAFALSPHMLQLGFLKLLHGCRLREQSALYGIEYDLRPPYRVLRTNRMGGEELADLDLCEDALNRLYNSRRFPATCEYLIKRRGDDGCLSSVLRTDMGRENRPSAPLGQWTPFQLFTAVGRFTGKSIGMPLETYIASILRFGASLPGVDLEMLRDCLVVDWLGTNHVGVLPVCLQRKDPLNAKIARALEERGRKTPGAPDLGSRRHYGFGLLYGNGRARIALADYRRPRPFLGNYPLEIFETEDLLHGDAI